MLSNCGFAANFTIEVAAATTGRSTSSRLVLLAFLFLFFALLVLLQELSFRIHFDAPLLAVFVYHGFVNGFALFCLLLDLDDLVTASFIFDCRLHHGWQVGPLNGLLFLHCGCPENRT